MSEQRVVADTRPDKFDTMADGGWVEHPLNLASRSEEEERLVRFAYFAQMASRQWEQHPAAASLLEFGYDVKAELEGLTEWLVAERDRLFPHSPAREVASE